jgi:2-polyprenyl-6-methoxyphenol hydroxylase-like FAD-dependent oxidoreductase
VETEVLIVGAGPVGLMAAIELRRRGIDVVIVDKRDDVAPWAKAVGVQPRTLEIFDAVGVVRAALNRATAMRGQLIFVNGEQVGRMELQLPDQVPYRFVSLPQYATEEVLAGHLAGLGATVRRGVEVLGVTAGEHAVNAQVLESGSQTTLSAEYVIGADGGHSVVRKSLGVAFSGDAFPEEYMLADVRVDWDMPGGYGIRAMHQTDGATDDLLVCIPLPGRGRYRMSMLVPDEFSLSGAKDTADDPTAHGLSTTGPQPELHHIQAVLDRLAPQPTTAYDMRWSSVFRISHRLVDRYSVGRAFLAGDAAHIHPPTGAQGMNTGLQDAYNLGWKLALAVRGTAGAGLLDTYHAERHPVGEEVVGRTVRAAREGIGAGETSVERVLMREAQLLVGYPDSPIVGGDRDADPAPGMRAPDATGLRQASVGFAMRCHDLLRHPNHTLLMWATGAESVTRALEIVDDVERRTLHRVRGYVIARGDADLSGRVLCDANGDLAAAYGFGDADLLPAACLVRPDGYVSFRTAAVDVDRLLDHLRLTMRLRTTASRADD